METETARAMQVCQLSKERLNALQKRERERRYLIPNWNIQKCFGLGTLKEAYNIPEEEDVQRKYMIRVERELKFGNISPWKYLKDEQTNDYRDGVEREHCFDWEIWNKRLYWSDIFQCIEQTRTTRTKNKTLEVIEN